MGTIQTPIVVEDGAWIAAFALIAGNVTIGQEALVTMGAVVFSDCEPRGAYRGNPAQRVGRRRIRDVPGVKRREPQAASVSDAGMTVSASSKAGDAAD
jgi:acetyltransferase-like isoleucine patch superfamily enzyme